MYFVYLRPVAPGALVGSASLYRDTIPRLPSSAKKQARHTCVGMVMVWSKRFHRTKPLTQQGRIGYSACSCQRKVYCNIHNDGRRDKRIWRGITCLYWAITIKPTENSETKL